MTPRDLVLAVIAQCSDRGEFGRTSLQKVSYFASLRLGVNLGHQAHFFGPYSSTVERDTDALAMSGLVEETVQVLGINPQGWPVRRYSYELTDDGRAAISEMEGATPAAIQEVNKLIRDIEDTVGSLDQRVLSAAAKVLYIAKEQERPIDFGEIGNLALEHGWKLDEPRVRQIAAMLERLGFAEAVGADPS